MFYLGIRNLDGIARASLAVTALLTSALLLLLHPRILFNIINQIMHRLGKPPLEQRVRGYALLAILCWNVLGLLWQSLAVFIIVQPTLGLPWTSWWMVAGAYCLAWCAGFLAFWAPAGLGVREIVFVGAMYMLLPGPFRQSEGTLALLGFLSLVLRLWSLLGEVLLTGIAYALDYRGVLGKPDAPGRTAAVRSVVSPTTEGGA
jgi:hypothetical protein